MTDRANQPAVIEAASAGVKDMADGSLRITFEFEPRHAAAAFALFGPRGRAVAVAALKDGSATVKESLSVAPVAKVPKGGEWAKLAGMWCADPDFWRWAREQTRPGFLLGDVCSAGSAAEFMRYFLDIDSRAQLDSEPAALEAFKVYIRTPFMDWMQEQGIVK